MSIAEKLVRAKAVCSRVESTNRCHVHEVGFQVIRCGSVLVRPKTEVHDCVHCPVGDRGRVSGHFPEVGERFHHRDLAGIEIEREQKRFKLNQQQYISKVVERFGLADAKPSRIPLDPAYLQQTEEEIKLPNNTQYLSLVGSLLYITVNTRPDIAVSVFILAQKSSCPSQLDWQEAKRVLRYLKATDDHKLHLGTSDAGLEMFADADWAGDHRNRKSNSGFLIRFGGGVIVWASRKQTCVSLSSTEAEFVALTEACQELCWLKKLLSDFGEDISAPVPTYEDNQSCIKLVTNGKMEKRSKHIETKYFYVRDLYEKQQIELKYCPTSEQLADILTKPLQFSKMSSIRQVLGIIADQVKEEC